MGDGRAAITAQALTMTILTVAHAGPPIDRVPLSYLTSEDHFVTGLDAVDFFAMQLHADDYFV
jgi:hypothetical protein